MGLTQITAAWPTPPGPLLIPPGPPPTPRPSSQPHAAPTPTPLATLGGPCPRQTLSGGLQASTHRGQARSPPLASRSTPTLSPSVHQSGGKPCEARSATCGRQVAEASPPRQPQQGAGRWRGRDTKVPTVPGAISKLWAVMGTLPRPCEGEAPRPEEAQDSAYTVVWLCRPPHVHGPAGGLRWGGWGWGQALAVDLRRQRWAERQPLRRQQKTEPRWFRRRRLQCCGFGAGVGARSWNSTHTPWIWGAPASRTNCSLQEARLSSQGKSYAER